MITNYSSIIEGLDLPDADDRHVLAAAIKVNANVIVTNNLKDFPEDLLRQFSLSAKSADDFLAETIDLENDRALASFKEMVLHRRNPDLDEFEVLDALRRNGLKDTANYLHALL